jgi:hypothetical protein
MIRQMLICATAMLAFAGLCRADSISYAGFSFKKKYIHESATMYYVQVPSDGSVFSVSKTDVQANDVVISSDAQKREALREEWRRNRDLREGVVVATEQPSSLPADSKTVSAGSDLKPPKMAGESNAMRGDGGGSTIPRVKLKNLPLGEALKATLRPMNLDYKVEGRVVWISTPERLRRESSENLETRHYALNSASGETLPKVVVRNLGGVQTSAQGYGQNYGNSPGYGGAAYSGSGGYRGSQSPTGMGYGGGGGGWGMPMVQSGPQFSNIAQLFTTIDDRMVGETPAIIGTSGLR